MRLYRVLPWDPAAAPDAPGGPLWVPRAFQGGGRHDAPDLYGCLYLAELAAAAIAELLAPFRGTGDLQPELLLRGGRPLALAELDLDADAAESLIDLDDPTVLATEQLRPSTVATGRRRVTQEYAAGLFARHAEASGLRWWSTLEASWLHVTLFDRAAPALGVKDVRVLSVDDETVLAAARHVGLA